MLFVELLLTISRQRSYLNPTSLPSVIRYIFMADMVSFTSITSQDYRGDIKVSTYEHEIDKQALR